MFPNRLFLLVLPAFLACDHAAAPTAPAESAPSPTQGKALTREQMGRPTLAPGFRSYAIQSGGPMAGLPAKVVPTLAKAGAGIVSEPTDGGGAGAQAGLNEVIPRSASAAIRGVVSYPCALAPLRSRALRRCGHSPLIRPARGQVGHGTREADHEGRRREPGRP